jgi:ribosomal protein L11 methyltransferase
LTVRWQVLTARVPDALDDEIAAVLGGGSLGVEIASQGPGFSELRVYLGPADDTDGWRERALRVLRAHGIGSGDARLAIDPVVDGRWVESWQASLSPLPLGARFVVLPTETSESRDGREPIRLVPGMAFGTGEHETTRLCAAGVERQVASGSRWLDLGTGTGLLAIVAAKCGAARVLAVDLDPAVGKVAAEVVTRNGAGDCVEVRAGSIDQRRDETFDGIVANIQASFFIGSAV